MHRLQPPRAHRSPPAGKATQAVRVSLRRASEPAGEQLMSTEAADVAEVIASPRRNRFMLAQWTDLLEDESFKRYWLMRLASHGANNALTYTLLVFVVP